MKKWETTYNDNHLRLMRVHIGFMVFYILLACLYTFFAYSSTNMTVAQLLIACLLFFLPLIILHTSLAIGAKNKLEISRKLSEIVFAFLLLAFPIGTIFSMLYFLPKTTWKMPNDDKK